VPASIQTKRFGGSIAPGIFRGPTAAFLDTNQKVYATICELVENAEERVATITPYAELPCKAASNPDCNVAVVLREDKVAEYERTVWFSKPEAAAISPSAIPKLHSKL